MKYNDLSEKDIAVIEDAKSLAISYREAINKVNGKFKGSLIVRTSNGFEYLYKKSGKVEKSLGRLDKHPCDIIEAFNESKSALIEKVDNLGVRIKSQAVLVQKTGISKIQASVANLIRTANQLNDLVVVGTNAIYAYESKFGVSLEASSLATMDLDIFIDSRKSLSLVFKEADSEKSILQHFRKSSDKSFELKHDQHSFSIENSDGFIIDFVTQANRPQQFKNKNIDLSEDDIQPTPIENLHWQFNSYKINEEVVFDTSGMPLFMKAPDPLAFAAYKLWLSAERASNPKSLKDRQQADSLICLLTDRGVCLDKDTLKGFPTEIMERVVQISTDRKHEAESFGDSNSLTMDFLRL